MGDDRWSTEQSETFKAIAYTEQLRIATKATEELERLIPAYMWLDPCTDGSSK
jgi:hypothetical protein